MRKLCRDRLALPLIALAALAIAGGCAEPQGERDGGADGGAMDLPPMEAPPDMMLGPIQTGALGAACTQESDCGKVTGDRICFRDHLLNAPAYQRTPGGYCSSYCSTQADCGARGVCVDLGAPTTVCMARCDRSGICRAGYACLIDDGICVPSEYLTCDPTANDGACQAQVDLDPMKPKVPGGCIRQTFENLGRCAPGCQIGAACPVDPQLRDAQHCVYMDTTLTVALRPTGDKWKGAVCMIDIVPSVGRGLQCQFFEQCQDGLQCDLWPGGSGRCQPLCVQGGTPGCAAGLSCQDALHAGPGGAGLCKQ